MICPRRRCGWRGGWRGMSGRGRAAHGGASMRSARGGLRGIGKAASVRWMSYWRLATIWRYAVGIWWRGRSGRRGKGRLACYLSVCGFICCFAGTACALRAAPCGPHPAGTAPPLPASRREVLSYWLRCFRLAPVGSVRHFTALAKRFTPVSSLSTDTLSAAKPAAIIRSAISCSLRWISRHSPTSSM